MSTVKFVYRSQNIPDTQPIEGSQHTITSGAVYTALKNKEMDTLFNSGYLPEGIAGYETKHVLEYANNTVTLKAGSVVHYPYGIKEGEFEFRELIINEDLTVSTTHSDNFDSFLFVEVTDDETKLVTCMKHSNKYRDGEKLDEEVQSYFAQKQQPIGNANYLYWWDLNENRTKYYNIQSESWEDNHIISIPIAIVTSEDNVITGIQQDFNIGGIAEDVCWINPGVTFKLPAGKTNSNTYAADTIVTEDVTAKVIYSASTVKFEDYGIYVSVDSEDNLVIEGPSEEYVFDFNKGVFLDSYNVERHSCRVFLVSADKLTTKTTSRITSTSFSIRPVLSLADSDDIDYVIRLIGSSMGLTIDDLTEMIKEANIDRSRIRDQISQWLQDLRDTIEDSLHHCITHKAKPIHKFFKEQDVDPEVSHAYVVHNNSVGFYKVTDEDETTDVLEYNPLTFHKLTKLTLTYNDTTGKYDGNDGKVYDEMLDGVYFDDDGKYYDLVIKEDESTVLTPDIAIDETIEGHKTFAETINGNISGNAETVTITDNISGKLIPVGLDGTDNQLRKITTNVRFSRDAVEAKTFDGVATKARWADLAEIYETDKEYAPGTLLRWGGDKELTLANFGVANAVVSESPAFLMNSSGTGQPIALAGRVKVRVLGKCKKHDPIVLNEMAPGTGKVQESISEPIIARCLEDNDFVGEKLVLCVVKFSL